MQILNIPQPYFPFKPAIHHEVENIHRHTLKWVQAFNLITTSAEIEMLKRSKFEWLAARNHPLATYEEICIAADLNTWLFLVDDKCDRLSMHPDAAIQLNLLLNNLIEMINGTYSSSRETVPLYVALSDILMRIKRISTPEWRARFNKWLIDYLEECLWEMKNQLNHYIPSEIEYMEMRPKTGFSLMFTFVELFDRIIIPNDILNGNTIEELALSLNLIASYANDLHSVQREKQMDTVGLNLVFILEKKHELTFESAVAEVYSRHEHLVAVFFKKWEQLSRINNCFTDEINRYLNGLCTHVKGYYEWAIVDTGRYRED